MHRVKYRKSQPCVSYRIREYIINAHQTQASLILWRTGLICQVATNHPLINAKICPGQTYHFRNFPDSSLWLVIQTKTLQKFYFGYIWPSINILLQILFSICTFNGQKAQSYYLKMLHITTLLSMMNTNLGQQAVP